MSATNGQYNERDVDADEQSTNNSSQKLPNAIPPPPTSGGNLPQDQGYYPRRQGLPIGFRLPPCPAPPRARTPLDIRSRPEQGRRRLRARGSKEGLQQSRKWAEGIAFAMAGGDAVDSGEKRLNELGYKQELRREMVWFYGKLSFPCFFSPVDAFATLDDKIFHTRDL
jgi:hypothetical protein